MNRRKRLVKTLGALGIAFLLWCLILLLTTPLFSVWRMQDSGRFSNGNVAVDFAISMRSASHFTGGERIATSRDIPWDGWIQFEDGRRFGLYYSTIEDDGELRRVLNPLTLIRYYLIIRAR